MLLRATLFLVAVAVFAQAQQAVPTKDPGVARAELIGADDVRVIRVEVQPGATRSLHTHDDVRAHLFLPITGSLEITIAGKTKPAPVGQAFRMDKGTVHGFHNTGTTVAMAYEVFLREDAKKGASNASLGAALALLAAH